MPIVTANYLYASLDKLSWLDVKEHECDYFKKKAERPNLHEVFKGTKIYIDIVAFENGFDYTSMCNLVKLMRTPMTENQKEASIIITTKASVSSEANKGTDPSKAIDVEGAPIRVDQKWLFDSIQKGKLQDTASYKC